MNQSLRIVIDHVVVDDRYCEQLCKQLAPLVRQERISLWSTLDLEPGSDRESARTQQIDSADVVLLLISPDYLASDACLTVSLDRLLTRQRGGQALVVPVLVKPAIWRSMPFGRLSPLPQDGRPVTSRRQADQGWGEVVEGLQRLINQPQRHDAEAMDGISSVEPPGGSYDSAWYIARPLQEEDARQRLRRPAQPVVLRGPEQCGKTWTLRRLLERFRQEQHSLDRVLALDMRQLRGEAWNDSASFFAALAQRLVQIAGGQSTWFTEAWAPDIAPTVKLTYLVEDRLLTALPEGGRLIFAIDHADMASERTASGSPISDQLFSMLRDWLHAYSDDPDGPWHRLRLVVCIASSPTYLTRNVHKSPFNVSDSIYIGDLRSKQIQQLAALYQLTLSDSDLATLQQRVGGHPYLLRLWFYRTALGGEPLSDVGATDPHLFDDFLHRLRLRLERSGLLEAARAVARGEGRTLEPHMLDLLDRMGLLEVPNPLETPSLPDPPRLRFGLFQRLLTP